MVLYIKEESRLRVFENRILRRILGPRWDTNEEWKRLHNEEIDSLYRSTNIVRASKSRRREQVRIEQGRSAFKILTGTATGKRPLGRPWRRSENNIRMDLEEICINAGN